MNVGDLIQHLHDQSRGPGLILSRHKESGHWLIEVMWGSGEKSLLFESEGVLIEKIQKTKVVK